MYQKIQRVRRDGLNRLSGLNDGVYLVAERGEGCSIEDFGGSVTHFFHRQVYPTDCLVPAVGAWYIGRLAGTGDRRQGTIEHPHDLSERDLCGITCKEVAAPLPFPALEDSVVSQAEQDELEELGRDLLRPSEVGDTHRLARRMFGKTKECFDCVFGLLREHALFSVGLTRIYSRTEDPIRLEPTWGFIKVITEED
jgi:hypothetical protein